MEEEEPGSVPWWSELNAVGLSVPTPLFLSALRDLRETLVMLVPVENQDGLARRYTPSQPGWTREVGAGRGQDSCCSSHLAGKHALPKAQPRQPSVHADCSCFPLDLP